MKKNEQNETTFILINEKINIRAKKNGKAKPKSKKKVKEIRSTYVK